MKKVFLNTMFGAPFPEEWTNGFIENVQRLEPFGWYWKIFTPNEYESKGNVEFIKMDIEDFDSRIEKATGINPHNYIDGVAPHKLVSDYYPAHGVIFPEYIKDADFWGHCNWDVVYGRLEHYLPDEFLEDCDIFGNDPDAINGVFSLYRNIDKVNNLFKKNPSWQEAFSNLEKLYTFDEDLFTQTVREAHASGDIRFKSAFWLQFDRQEQHKPKPILKIKDNGALVDKNNKEMMLFHFSFTKKWPL